LLKAKTEEEVKHAYAEAFRIGLRPQFRHDPLLPESVLNSNSPALQKREARAASSRSHCIMCAAAAGLRVPRRATGALRGGFASGVFFPGHCEWRNFTATKANNDWTRAKHPTPGWVSDHGRVAETNAIRFRGAGRSLIRTGHHRPHSRATQLTRLFRVRNSSPGKFSRVLILDNVLATPSQRTKSFAVFLWQHPEGRRSITGGKQVVFLGGPRKNAEKILPRGYEWSGPTMKSPARGHQNIMARWTA